MSIRSASNYNQELVCLNHIDILDQYKNVIRLAINNKQLYISQYDIDSTTWYPASLHIGTNGSNSHTINDYQTYIDAENIRLEFFPTTPINGNEIMIFKKIGNYGYLQRSLINLNIDTTSTIPSNSFLTIQQDNSGNYNINYSSLNLSNYALLSQNQTISGINTFTNNLILSNLSNTSSTETLLAIDSSGIVKNTNINYNNITTPTNSQIFTTNNKTFDYSSSKLRLTNTSNDTTTTNNLLTLDSTGFIIPSNKTINSICNNIGYANLINGSPSYTLSLIITNPLNTSNICVFTSVSKTLNSDNNYVLFNNTLTTITDSTITFLVSASSSWYIDSNNIYTLFYNIVAKPNTNYSYSFNTIYIPNLIHYFNFDVSTITDSITNTTYNNNNSSLVSAKFNSGLSINNGFYINPSISASSITVSFWCKYNSNGPYTHINFYNNWNDINNTNLTSNSVQLTWANSTSDTLSYDSTIFNHTVIIINSINSTTSIYFNNTLAINTSTSNLSTGNSINQFYLLTNDTSNGQIIDDLRIYNRILTDTEINLLYTKNPSNINV
jgi:hypothetical protein